MSRERKADMTNKVENTTKTAQESPASILVEAIIAGPAGGHIEAMEARGTAQLAESSILPSNGLVEAKSPMGCYADWAEKCGIQILDLVDGDDIFVNAKLPDGWRQKTTDHGMWNDLVDDKGRKRAGIFYKAAFYDRSAFIRPNARFIATYECNWEDHTDKHCWGVVRDGGKIIWKGGVLESAPSPWNPDGPPVQQSEVATLHAKRWVEERYPDFENTAAYWEAT